MTKKPESFTIPKGTPVSRVPAKLKATITLFGLSSFLWGRCGGDGRSDRLHAVCATGHGDGLGVARRGRCHRGRGRGGRRRWSDCDRGGGRHSTFQ